MKRLTIAAALTALMAVTLVFAAKDAGYKSWEVAEVKKLDKKEVILVRFRLNIPHALDYAKARRAWIENELKSATPERATILAGNWTNYNIVINGMSRGKKLLNVFVFGDFNSWKTATSDMPNKLEPSKGNPDTYYTRTYVSFDRGPKKKQYRYKFVLDYGMKKADDGSETFDYVYIEDPLSGKNKNDDGFGGFNSFFVYSN